MLTSYATKIFTSFDSLSRILENEGENLVIYDDPVKIVIKRDRIEFYVLNEFHGFVDKSSAKLSEKVSYEAEMWLKALANLKFRRFSLRR
ncbi:MAG: hypothetical protein RMH75_05435 [Archaeoglobaceae archaeon]|nr:hypothetical protein [Archaeoglobaceae archaeon]MDW7990086.1 hypothetical protein [Archaeoglobaceae archaeon]